MLGLTGRSVLDTVGRPRCARPGRAARATTHRGHREPAIALPTIRKSSSRSALRLTIASALDRARTSPKAERERRCAASAQYVGRVTACARGWSALRRPPARSDWSKSEFLAYRATGELDFAKRAQRGSRSSSGSECAPPTQGDGVERWDSSRPPSRVLLPLSLTGSSAGRPSQPARCRPLPSARSRMLVC